MLTMRATLTRLDECHLDGVAAPMGKRLKIGKAHELSHKPQCYGVLMTGCIKVKVVIGKRSSWKMCQEGCFRMHSGK